MNKNKGFIGIGLILAIVLGIVVVGGGAYYLGKGSSKQEVKSPENILPNNENKNLPVAENQKAKVAVSQSSEESSTEIFDHQAGIIKSIKSNETNKWTFVVDLLSRNSKWTPGDDNEPFFLNQNTKIRNLNVNSSTKTYECGDSPDTGAFGPFILSNTLDTIKQIQPDDIKYFDINGTNITTIYEQCLP